MLPNLKRYAIILLVALSFLCSFSAYAVLYKEIEVYEFGADILPTSTSYLAYNSTTSATINYKVHPTGIGFSPTLISLRIRQTTSLVRSIDLTDQGVGDKTTSWDGKNDQGSPVDPGIYTATIEVVRQNGVDVRIATSDGHNITVVKVEIKAEDGESEPPKYILVNKTTDLKAKVLPQGLTGDFKWQITQGAEYAQITAGQDQQTVTLKGITPTRSKVKLKLTFKPTGATEWFDVDEHEFSVMQVEIKAEDGESEPAEYIIVGTTTNFKAKVLPKELTGKFKWEITKGKEYAQIVAGQDQQTVSVKGLAPSTTGGKNPKTQKVKLKLMFKPDDDTEWYNVDEHEFIVVKVEFKLKQISFLGTNSDITKDDGSVSYIAPHWQDNSLPLDGDADDPTDRKYPVCFTRNTKMKVSTKFIIDPAFSGTVKVKGDGPGNVDIPESVATLSGNELTIANIECLNAFVNEIDIFDPLEIQWKVSLDNGITWFDAGTSKNQAYVTLGDPLTTVYHTLVYLGCKNANGETTDTGATAKIWSEFTDRVVKRVDGVQLTYYASYTCENVTTATLLANGDGQCGAWAKFFIDMRKVQGIDDTNEYVIFEPISDDGFIVKNWTFTGTGSSGHPTHPFLNIPDTPLIGTNSYNWKFAEVNDATGIPGQGNANPASLFSNHQVVIRGQYYDPSYGVQHATLQDIDNNTIDGFYIGPGTYPVDEPTVNLDLNGDGDRTDMGVNTTVILFRKNPTGLNIQETRLDY